MSKKTPKAEKPLRKESEVIDDLGQLSEVIKADDITLKEGNAKLKRLERALKDKRAEVALQKEENQQQIEILEADYQHYSKQNQDLQARKLEMQQEALAEMVSSAKEGVDGVVEKIRSANEEYEKINQQVKDLQSNQYWLREFEKLTEKEELVELLKGDTSSLKLDDRQKELVQEILAYSKKIGSSNINEALDDYLEQETDKLGSAIIRADKNKKELEGFVDKIRDKAEEQNVDPGEFLSSLIEYAKQERQEKLSEITVLEKEQGKKEQEFQQIQKATQKWDAPYSVALPEDDRRELERRVEILQQKQEQAREELIAVDREGFDTNKRLALELNALGKEVEQQRLLVEKQNNKVDQNFEKFAALEQERDQIKKEALAKKKAAKKEVDEPEQEFYLSDTPKYSQLQETIRHRKEINVLKGEHALAMSSQSDELEQLRAENLRLQQAQEQMQRELQKTLELLEQSKVSAVEPPVIEQAQGRSLLDELSELDPAQLVGSPLEEEVRQARATRPDVLLQSKDEEIALLKAKLEQLELGQEDLDRTKENLRLMTEARDQLQHGREEERQGKEAFQHDVELLQETLDNREQELEVQTREKEKLAREISVQRDKHRQELLDLEQSKNLELGTLQSQLMLLRGQVEQVNLEKLEKQRDLERVQGELASTKLSGTELASQLEVAQQSLSQGKGNAEALGNEVAQLKEQIRLNQLAQEQQRVELVGAKERAELATSQQKESYEQLLKQVSQEAVSQQARVGELEQQIGVVQSKLEFEQRKNDELLQQNSEKLEEVRAQLAKATKGSEKAVELQQEVDRLGREKQELVSQGQAASVKHERELVELRQSKDLEREELGKSKDQELALMSQQLLLVREESLAKQNDLERVQGELASTKLSGTELASQLQVAQQSLLRGGSDKQGLTEEVARLNEQIRQNGIEQERQRAELVGAKEELAVLEKENRRVQKHVERAQQELDQIAKPTKKVTTRDERGQETVAPSTIAKVSDKVAVSNDQILQEFRALKDRQREVIVGSGAVEGIPQGNEAFHKYASENGALIGSKIDPETAKLMNDMEREKYKEIHAKYPYKDIDWQGGKKASISKDGVEICKLNDGVPAAKEYNLNGKVISNFRSLDVPLKADDGPMHISLAVKDLQGNNISAKEAVYLSAHYDDKGKLVEMTTPVPVYFTSQDKESPVCIKQDGRVYTLPINRGKYEEMQKQIAINKGLSVEKIADLSQDQVGVVTKPVHKAKQVLEGNQEAVDKLKRHSSAHHSSYPPRSPSKGSGAVRDL